MNDITTIQESLPLLIFGWAMFLLIAVCFVLDLVILRRLRHHPPNWTGLSTALRSRPWTLRDVIEITLIALCLVSLLRFMGSLLFQHLSISESQTLTLLFVANTLLVHIPLFLLIASGIRKKRISWYQSFGIQRADTGLQVGRGIVFYLAALPLFGAAGLVWALFLIWAGISPQPQDTVLFMHNPQPGWIHLYLGLVAVVAAPVMEELIFRGIFLPGIAKKVGTPAAVVLTSLLFALIHFNLLSYVPLFFISVAFSLAYIYSGSILVPIVMHSVFNAASIAVLLFISRYPDLFPYHGPFCG